MLSKDLEKRMIEALDYLNNDSLKSLEIFEEIIDEDAGNVKALNGKATALLKLKRYDEAMLCSQQSLSICETANAYITMGHVQKYNKNYDDALVCYDKAVSIDNNLSVIVEILKADVLDKISLLRKYEIVKEFSLKVQQLIKDGIQAQNNHRIWDALEYFNLALKEDASCKVIVDTHFDEIKKDLGTNFIFRQPFLDYNEISRLKLRAFDDFIENDYDDALLCVNKILDFCADDLDALNIKGTVLFIFDDYNEAMSCFNHCISIDSDYIYAYFNKIVVLKRLSRLNEAVTCARQLESIMDSRIKTNLRREKVDERLCNLLEMPLDDLLSSS